MATGIKLQCEIEILKWNITWELSDILSDNKVFVYCFPFCCLFESIVAVCCNGVEDGSVLGKYTIYEAN